MVFPAEDLGVFPMLAGWEDRLSLISVLPYFDITLGIAIGMGILWYGNYLVTLIHTVKGLKPEMLKTGVFSRSGRYV